MIYHLSQYHTSYNRRLKFTSKFNTKYFQYVEKRRQMRHKRINNPHFGALFLHFWSLGVHVFIPSV